MRKFHIGLTLIIFVFLISACAGKNDEDKVQLVDANSEIQTLYSNRCLNCHAIDLSGEMSSSTNIQKVYERLTYDEIVNVISNGKGIMPAFNEKLTTEEISMLAAWLSKQ